jgi:hypothetical protein
MVALDTDARSKGRKVMEEALTPAGRVRRQLKAGRPRKIKNEVVSTFEAVRRIVDEADRAHAMMDAADLNKDDIRLAVVYSTPERPGSVEQVGYKVLPASKDLAKFFTFFEDLAATIPVIFLGILWQQMDHEAAAKGQPGGVIWFTQWMGGPKVEKMLFTLRDYLTMTNGNLSNN